MAANSRAAGRPLALVAPRLAIRAPAALMSIVAGSALVRGLTVLWHPAPVYFPDEYIYASIARSIAEHGRPLVRGGPAHFPALLEPLLAAPLWAVASVETAYHLVQLENVLFLSLAAIPVYALARRLELGAGWSLLSAAFAVAIPEGAFAGYILADSLGYLLALCALYSGVVALQRGGARAGVTFVVVAGLATLTRVQYVVLAPAFVVAALGLDRRAAFRLHRWVLGIFGACAAAVLAIGAGRILGYYSAISKEHVGWGLLRWFGLELFFFALASGVVLLPGAVVGLCSARERRDRAFAALAIPFAFAIFVEGAVYASNMDVPRLKERYLMVLMPLVPLAFGVYLRLGRPGRLLIAASAAAIAAVASLLPLSGYASAGVDEAPLLWSYVSLQWELGLSNASLVFALCATAGAALAAAAAWGRLTRTATAVALLLMTAITVGAVRFDIYDSGQIRSHLEPASPTWVDDAGLGDVAAVETPFAPPGSLLQQLFWNPSITQELLFGSSASATDAFRTGQLQVGRDGTLLVHGEPLRTAILYQNFEASPVLEGARKKSSFGSFTLWQPTGTMRLRALEVGRYGDGWLGLRGVLRVWPTADRGTVSFTLSLPRGARTPVRIRFGARALTLTPGGPKIPVVLRVRGRAPWSIHFVDVDGASVLADGRFASVRSTLPVYAAG